MIDPILALRIVAAVAVLEAVAVVVLVGVVVHLYREFTKSQRELLDRLMSRNLTEYKVMAADRTPARKRALTDAEMADKELKRATV